MDLLTDLDVVTPGSVSPEPWANGLGVTRVLCDRLAWRLSIAEIRGRMPFSAFPGRDRLLIPLNDDGITLGVDGAMVPVARNRGIRFPGEARVVAQTGGGTVSVVNVMVRRGLADVSWQVRRHTGRIDVDPADAATVVLAGDANADGLPLPPGSLLLATPRPRTVHCDTALVAHIAIASHDGARKV